ncbi:MAG: reductase [Oscillospiraceae bacterium]|nr:reductase [Oscillospiraceae bacterium]
MKILVLGGTRYFGIPTVQELIRKGHDVTIATRGRTPDPFGSSVSRIVCDRTDNESMKVFDGSRYDIIIDKIAYTSNDVKRLLDHAECGRYILMSTSSVYTDIHLATKEDDFRADKYPLEYCERGDHDYSEIKRQAECILVQDYPSQVYTAVRYPVVTGINDYTGRLRFYFDLIAEGKPMYIDDMDSRISFIDEKDAGHFISHIVEHTVDGPVNGCSDGDISIREIIGYIEGRTGKKAVLSDSGDAAPYNGYPAFATLDTAKARSTGFVFSDVRKCIYDTIDHYTL